MKILSLILIFSIGIMAHSKAQDVELSAKAGMNVATLGNADMGYASRIGYHLGGMAEFITTPFFSIQAELLYSLQGAATDQSHEIYLNYHYLNVPLLAKAYFYEHASFEIGIQYGFLLKAVEKNDIYSQNQSDLVKSSDFAGVFGVAYKLDEKFTFGVRYNLGTSNTAKQKVVYEQRLTNKVLQISIGYIL